MNGLDKAKRKPRLTTLAIANRASGPIPIGLGILANTAESFGFGI